MRSNTNEKFVATRAQWAKILTFAGMACLVISALVMNKVLALAWGVLVLGFLVSSVGTNLAARYIREPTAEGALEKALKGFDDHHVLYNYLLPVEHVFSTPSSVWVIVVKKQPGRFSYDGKKWRQKITLVRLLGFLGEPSLGHPLRDIEADTATVREKLAQGISDPEVPVRGVLVFTDPRATVEIKGASQSVVMLDNLKSFFRRELKGMQTLPSENRREIERLLDEWTS